jgi:hypothetical protein
MFVPFSSSLADGDEGSWTPVLRPSPRGACKQEFACTAAPVDWMVGSHLWRSCHRQRFQVTTNFDACLEFSVAECVRPASPRIVKLHGGLNPLRRSIGELEDSNLSRLFRIVRDWVTEADEEPSDEVSTGPEEKIAPGGKFLTLLAEGHHQLLEREAGEEPWEWFLEWQMLAVALAEDIPSLSGHEVLGLILDELIVRRLAPKPAGPTARHARAERLMRLAASVIPHAPPRSALNEQMPTEVG